MSTMFNPAVPPGASTPFNLPNYAGMLAYLRPTDTPLLSMIGGLSGGGIVIYDNYEFATSQYVKHPAPSQPSITLDQSIAGVDATLFGSEQEKNVVQIHQYKISLSDFQQATTGRISGVASEGQSLNSIGVRDRQIALHLEKMAMDMEYSFIKGQYNNVATSSQPFQTRGVLQAITDLNGIHLDAGGASLDLDMLKQLYVQMQRAGAGSNDLVLMASPENISKITDLYTGNMNVILPTNEVGGIRIRTIATNTWDMGIVGSNYIDNDTILIVNPTVMAPAFLEVPGKGTVYEEELAKTGTADNIQLVAHIGLDHGPSNAHGAITGLG